MKQVGLLLRNAREAKGLHLEDVEKITKIRAKFLRSIEEDSFEEIPSIVYTKGFIKNYSDFLGLDTPTILAFFRRQTSESGRAPILPNVKEEPLSPPWFTLTPSKFITLLLGMLIFFFLLYFGFQYRQLQKPPVLIMEKPGAEQIFEERKIEVIGKTNPDATVTVNGIGTIVRSDGKFFDQVSLEPGVNTITVMATSRFGKSTTVIRKVGLKQ